MRHLNRSDLLHSLLSLLLLFQKFPLSAYIASVTLCRYVLAYRLNGFAGNNLCAYGGLYRYIELLTRYELLQLLAHTSAKRNAVIHVR